MTYNEVLKEAMSLTESEQKELVKALRFDYSREERIRVQILECKGFVADYTAKMGQALGVDPKMIFSTKRNRILVNIRWVIWHDLWHRDYPTTVIARSCGYHHSIIRRGVMSVDDVRKNPAYDPELWKVVEAFDKANQ